MGYYIKKHAWRNVEKASVYILGVVSLILTIFLTIYQSSYTTSYVETWFSPGSPFVLLMSVAVFMLFYSMSNSENAKWNKWVHRMSDCTFFVYMFHVFILEKLNAVGITTISFNPMFSVPLLTTLAFAISIVCALIVCKIPMIGKVLLYQ